MFKTNIDGLAVELSFKNKLSFNCFSSVIDLKINGVDYPLSADDLILQSEEMLVEDEMFVRGNFKLANGITFSEDDSLALQKMYAQWEESVLSRSNVLYKMPVGREDQSAGIARFNPFFHALMTHIGRKQFGFGGVGLGRFFESNELDFAYQYIAYHPDLHGHLAKREAKLFAGGRVILNKEVAKKMARNACMHIEGYRDSERYRAVWKKNSQAQSSESYIKHLMEYDHVLDSGIHQESLNLASSSSSGGLLNILDLPF